MTWHAEPAALTSYRDGTLSPAGRSSVEAHLLRCARCRESLAPLVPIDELDTMWHSIITEIETPRVGMLERLLGGLGVNEHLAGLVGLTPSLRAPWLAGVAAVLALAVALAHGAAGGSTAFFMALAPLLPVAGVAVAFGPGVDPTYELVVAAPIRAFDLLVARALAVLATTLPLAALAALALPDGGWEVLAWLLPALALTTTTLAASTWVAPWKAAAVLALVWAGAASALALRVRPDPRVIDLITGPQGQILMVGLVLVAAAVVMARRGVFDVQEVR